MSSRVLDWFASRESAQSYGGSATFSPALATLLATDYLSQPHGESLLAIDLSRVVDSHMSRLYDLLPGNSHPVDITRILNHLCCQAVLRKLDYFKLALGEVRKFDPRDELDVRRRKEFAAQMRDAAIAQVGFVIIQCYWRRVTLYSWHNVVFCFFLRSKNLLQTKSGQIHWDPWVPVLGIL